MIRSYKEIRVDLFCRILEKFLVLELIVSGWEVELKLGNFFEVCNEVVVISGYFSVFFLIKREVDGT